MSPAPLTDRQRQAAHHEAGDVCVLAGAGSGKTTVLTERFRFLVEVLEARPRRVAALTFTDASAAEMRERIAREFAAAEDPRTRAWARDVEFAPISTIHAFGARLLREHAIAAGVDPAFVLLDATEARLLLESCWQSLDQRLRRARDPALAVLARLGEEEAWRCLLELHERLRGDGLTARDLVTRRVGTVRDAQADLARAFEDLEAALPPRPLAAKDVPAYRTTLAALPRLPDAAAADEACARQALEVSGRNKGEVVKLPNRGYTDVRDALIAAYERLGRAILDDVAAREVEGPVRRLVEALEEAYAQAKRSEGALDFADLERETLALLDRLEAQGRPLESRPVHLLVDEFQDVNPLQARIFERLRRPRRGRRADLFAVGDPKQSIYGFRRADVEVMVRLWEEVGEAGRHALPESFRSRRELVAFHNELFARLFAQGAGGVAYEPLEKRGHFFDEETEISPEILVVEATDYDGPALDAEAEAVARRLRALVDAGTPRTKPERDARGQPTTAPRPLRWGDMAVLLRTNGQAPAFERALLAAGIPFQVGRGRGFYDTPEIEDLLHLLRVAHDPRDTFAFAAFLTSPAVGGTDEDLLACFGGDLDPWEAALARPSLAPALAHVVALRRLAVEGSLEEVVRGALERFALIPIALLQRGGARRARNLEKALAIARRLDDQGGHGLLDFLRRLEALRAREIDEPEASAGAPDDAVALLTVHAAKGLEWPVVVVARLRRHLGGGSNTPAFLTDGHGGIGWRLRDLFEGGETSTGGWVELQAQRMEADAREELRLLYVALTRAQERLLLSWSFSGRKKDGRPTRLTGWSASLTDLLGGPGTPGATTLELGSAKVSWRLEVAPPAAEVRPGDSSWAARHRDGAGFHDAAEADLALARTTLADAQRVVETMGRTPYVVTISDLLAFAQDPQAYYVERLVGGGDPTPATAPRFLGAHERQDPRASEGPPELGEAVVARQARWDEGREVLEGLDRAALGRAVHLAIERLTSEAAASAKGLADTVEAALSEEFPAPVPEAARSSALAMVARFLESGPGHAFLDALRRGEGLRREVSFHARIRFPEGSVVGGLDSLLVKGSIDLWREGPDGAVFLHDHKTNSPRSRWPDAAALAAHYGPQLRLYALAAERLVGREVAGASLLLLDPAWGERGVPVEVPIDVGGAALEATRRLCWAYAQAMHDERFLPGPG